MDISYILLLVTHMQSLHMRRQSSAGADPITAHCALSGWCFIRWWPAIYFKFWVAYTFGVRSMSLIALSLWISLPALIFFIHTFHKWCVFSNEDTFCFFVGLVFIQLAKGITIDHTPPSVKLAKYDTGRPMGWEHRYIGKMRFRARIYSY